MKHRPSVSVFFFIVAGFFLQLIAPYIIPMGQGGIFFFPAFLFYGLSRVKGVYPMILAVLFGSMLDVISAVPFGFYAGSFFVGAGIMGIAGIYIRMEEGWIRFLFALIGLTVSAGAALLLRLPQVDAHVVSVSGFELLWQGCGVSILAIAGGVFTRIQKNRMY